jgi:hypothetical protein
MKGRVHKGIFSTGCRNGCAFSLVLLLAVTPAAFADPLYVRNLAPVAGLLGFPVLRDARPLEQRGLVFELNASAANTQTSDSHSGGNGGERVVLDGETWRLAPRLRYGLGGGWEVEAELPWLRHSGGGLDKLIENWHELFSLPDGDREDVPRDQLLYGYQGAGANFVDANTAGGLGDASLGLVRAVWNSPRASISLRGNIKFASGDEDDWLGSGSEDYSLGLNASMAPAPQSDWLWHGQLGYTRAGKIARLGEIQERDLWYAGLGMEWRAWESLHVKLQLDAHAAPTDSRLEQLGDPAVMLSAGLSWAPAPRWELDFGFSEDIAVNTAADIVFQFGVRYR